MADASVAPGMPRAPRTSGAAGSPGGLRMTDAEEAPGASLVDYRAYELSRLHYWLALAAGCAAAFLGAYLFYHSLWAAVLLAGLGAYYPRMRRASLLRRRRRLLGLQFKEALYSLTASLAAGRSVENAFEAAIGDLLLVYADPGTDIIREIRYIIARLHNGEPFERSLRQFSDRAGIDEIQQFTDVLAIAKRSGGDLVEIMRRTSQAIGEKLEVEQEIAVMMAQKRFETRIMLAVPFVFMAFLSYAAPDYMAPLYQGAGYVLITAALAALALIGRIVRAIMAVGF